MKVVSKHSPDVERSKSLIIESEKKFKFFEKIKLRLGFNELYPNYVVDTCYDIVLQLIRAKMLFDGYKTDSHEAEVSYMKILEFSENEVNFMNQLRYYRNGIKYYGTILDEEYAKKVFEFVNKIIPKIKKILK